MTDTSHFPVFLLAGTILFAIFACFVIGYVIIYARRQRRNEQERLKMVSDHQKHLLNARLEEQERFMKQLSRELHVQVSEKIDLTRTNLKEVLDKFPAIDRNGTLATGLAQLEEISGTMQNIGYSMSSEYLRARGLADVLAKDLDYIKESGAVGATSLAISTYQTLDPMLELIIYRVAQDALQNVVKHARAGRLEVELRYDGFRFSMTISDDGRGFDGASETIRDASGFRNMRQRAELLAGALFVQSTRGAGCRVTLAIDDVAASAMRLKS